MSLILPPGMTSTPFKPEDAPGVLRYIDKPMHLQSTQILKLWRERPVYFVKDHFDLTPDIWQEEALQYYMDFERVALVASKGPGKAQPLDTITPTPKGPRRFGDLKRGDFVFGEDGKPTKVVNIYPQGLKPSYRVTFDDGSSTECCDEHLWKVKGFLTKARKERKWGVLSLREIMQRGLFVTQGRQTHHHFQIPVQGPVKMPVKKLPIDPYVLGCWIGDGSADRGEITSADSEIVDEIERRGYEVRVRPEPSAAYNVGIKGLKVKLTALGISKKRSYEKSIPHEYLNASIPQRLDLLKGLMDTDGTIDKRDSCMEYSTTSHALALDVQKLVRSLGGKSTIKTKRGMLKGVEHRLCYRVRVTLPVCPFNLRRKAMHWKAPSQDRYLCRTIKKIEFVEYAEMQCIEVADPNHCYLTNDYIVTHNTAWLSWVGLHFLTMYYETKLAALSITKDHLKDNLWSELLKWRSRSEVLKQTISDGSEKIEIYGKEGIAFISARSFPKSANESEMQSALAGLHADNVGFLLDETGQYPDSMFSTADAALANADHDEEGKKRDNKMPKRARILAVSNPERPSGIIYRAFNGDPILSKQWKVMNITSDPENPKRARRVTKEWAQGVIDLYGRDHIYTKINVFGEYPDSTTEMLLSEREIDEAMNRKYKFEEYQYKQQRMGIDVARGGSDSTILFRRQGVQAFEYEMISSDQFGPQVAASAFHQRDLWGVNRFYVDNTGGYGGSVIDFLRTDATADVIPVTYQAASVEPKKYNNVRTQNWVRMRDWVRNGGALPKDEMLKKELLAPKLFYHGTQFKLESKEDIKKRIGRSPDRADALAQTFADSEDFSGLGKFEKPPERDILAERFFSTENQPKYYSDSSQIDNYYERLLQNYKA